MLYMISKVEVVASRYAGGLIFVRGAGGVLGSAALPWEEIDVVGLGELRVEERVENRTRFEELELRAVLTCRRDVRGEALLYRLTSVDGCTWLVASGHGRPLPVSRCSLTATQASGQSSAVLTAELTAERSLWREL